MVMDILVHFLTKEKVSEKMTTLIDVVSEKVTTSIDGSEMTIVDTFSFAVLIGPSSNMVSFSF